MKEAVSKETNKNDEEQSRFDVSKSFNGNLSFKPTIQKKS